MNELPQETKLYAKPEKASIQQSDVNSNIIAENEVHQQSEPTETDNIYYVKDVKENAEESTNSATIKLIQDQKIAPPD